MRENVAHLSSPCERRPGMMIVQFADARMQRIANDHASSSYRLVREDASPVSAKKMAIVILRIVRWEVCRPGNAAACANLLYPHPHRKGRIAGPEVGRFDDDDSRRLRRPPSRFNITNNWDQAAACKYGIGLQFTGICMLTAATRTGRVLTPRQYDVW